MKRHYRYTFLITHDYGQFFTSVISYNKKSALKMIMEAEGLPKRAVEHISLEPVTL